MNHNLNQPLQGEQIRLDTHAIWVCSCQLNAGRRGVTEIGSGANADHHELKRGTRKVKRILF